MTGKSHITTSDSSKPFFVPDKLAIAVSLTLLVLASVSWIASYYFMPLMMRMSASDSGMMASGVAGIVSSLSPASISIFEIIWVIGMAAMMFPAVIPIVLFYNKVAARQKPNPFLARIVGMPLFLSGYLITYVLLGLGAYFAVYKALNISMNLSQSFVLLSVLPPSAVLNAIGIF